MNDPSCRDASSTGASSGGGCCGDISRRQLLAAAGLAAGVSAIRSLPRMAGPFENQNEYLQTIPSDKKLDAAWVRSLYDRGEKQVYRNSELKYIGMPVGGIGAGMVYVGGDGRLWLWEIFNRSYDRGFLGRGADGDTYLNPFEQIHPFAQGFQLIVEQGGASQTRVLETRDFDEVTFDGRYPLGIVTYRDAGCPVQVTLEAFSPFIPLDLENSSYPATVLRYTLRNAGDQPVAATLVGSSANPVCLDTGRSGDIQLRNRIQRTEHAVMLVCSAERPASAAQHPRRPDILFEDFETAAYEGWEARGEAFGSCPIATKDIPAYQGDVRGVGERVVNSHASAPGRDIAEKDGATGTLTSRPFKIERRWICFRIGGGHHADTAVRLTINGETVREERGRDRNAMRVAAMDVAGLEGREARLVLIDQVSGGWGNLGVDHIVFTDTRPEELPFEHRPDFGTFALALMGRADIASAALDPGQPLARAEPEAVGPAGEPLAGVLAQRVELPAGGEEVVTFVFAWHMPNLELSHLGRPGRWYASRFPDAAAVAEHLAEHLESLVGRTRRWVATWYDSTLPYWLLDRAMANTSTLATNVCYLFADGRFYGWEGINCCEGTCTHVWHYAQAPGRLFPQIERLLRERVDLGIGLHPDGAISHRTLARSGSEHADDGQCGRILSVLREHQMSSDDSFLRGVWPRVRRAVEFMMRRDADGDGLLDGAQPNTLDAAWFGKISFTSSLFLAALRGGERLARRMGDDAFADRCATIAERGASSILELYNGEYFMHIEDPAHLDQIGVGSGCYIDQIFGQTWAHWTGLGRLFDRDKQLAALRALWKYNFVPDVGAFRKRFPRGRWYAAAGDAGLLMCTWPRGGQNPNFEKHWQSMYFNECMSGFEWQAAAHFIYEGLDQPDLLEDGLAVARAIHDRYDARLRNPYNEIECSDHYARALASYGVFQAVCGYEYDGPAQHLAFAPRLTPDAFRCAFTAAAGWGTFDQQRTDRSHAASLALRHGTLVLKTLGLRLRDGFRPQRATAALGGKSLDTHLTVDGSQAAVAWPEPLTIGTEETLRVTLLG